MVGPWYLLLVCILVISFIVVSNNFVVIESHLNNQDSVFEVNNFKEQKNLNSFKLLRKRNTFDENGNLDLYPKASTKPSNTMWFQLTSPSSAYRLKATDDKGVDEQVQGLSNNLMYETVKHSGGLTVDSLNSFSIEYIGCFSTWEKQYTNFQVPDPSQRYDDTQLHITCARKCRQRGEQMQVIFVKGAECQCSATYEFNAKLIRRSNCNIPCPVRNLVSPATSHEIPDNPCGGNKAYSVYCISGPGNCNELVQEVHQQSRRVTEPGGNPIKISEQNRKKSVAVISRLCAKCSLQNCLYFYTYPDFDYFPANSPQQCVDYCSTSVSYVRIKHSEGQPEEMERYPTQYAALLWWKDMNTNLPICSCVDESFLEKLEYASSSECNMTCPGQSDAICGGIERNQFSFMTVYCAHDPENGGCKEVNTPTTTPKATTMMTSTDPCMNEEFDCDVPPEISTTEEDINATDETNPTIIPTTESTISESPPTTPSSTTTAITKPSIYTTETTFKSSTIIGISPTTTAPLLPDCILKCQAYDRRGYFWEVCAGNEAIVRCADLNKNSNASGLAFWRCSNDATFVTSHPDVSNCTSSWLQEKHEEIEKIQNIGEADTFVSKLAQACKNAGLSNSNSKFYGHEIKNITSLVDQIVQKARGFHMESVGSKFSELEKVIEKAVDLNAFLMQFHDPWKDLPLPEKSILSTAILANTEEALFHLTYEAHADNYTKIFAVNTSEANKFLVFAETFDKQSNSLGQNYEFPPNKVRGELDSYIKLPAGWSNRVPNNQIEISAMSIESEYISSIMPGQYENLVSVSTLDKDDDASAANVKLINARLISLSLLTAKDQQDTAQENDLIIKRPSISFTGKGVEITFHHDIEAWGSDVQNVPRNLHPDELPKAVLGSSECVYWDTKTYSWSSKGCKIVKATRYETVCECNHLTSFAVLMDVHRYVGKDFGLELLTLILCPASEVALFISILILSSIGGTQKMRASITTNLSFCLLVGNALVLFVLDRNYFNMSEGVCMGAAMVTHYTFLCAFMWMLIEGIQLYRMVVHVFDSGRSYIKQFAIFAYGSPLIVITITATTGYLKGDKPYGGDMYCWLEGSYIWSFMGPVAIVTTVNFVILFIALKTAYQVQQSKKNSPVFIMGKIRSYKTWFKGCFSLTAILGLTWAVGFFTLMKSSGGLVAAYIFIILNASQGLFIFLFNCVFNEKVRSFTQRNLSTYLPSWLSSSMSSNPGGNDGSTYGKRPLSSMKSGDSVPHEKGKKRTSARRQISNPIEILKGPTEKISHELDPKSISTRRLPRTTRVDFAEALNTYCISDSDFPGQRTESIGTVSSVDSIPNSSASETGHTSSDNSQSNLISRVRF